LRAFSRIASDLLNFLEGAGKQRFYELPAKLSLVDVCKMFAFGMHINLVRHCERNGCVV
jgi:hypothetical protein